MKPKHSSYENITGDIGQLYGRSSEPKYTMFSFDRPAYMFWQGFYEGLIDRDFTHAEAISEMASKGARWLLDSEGRELKSLGRKMAETYAPFVIESSVIEARAEKAKP